MINEPSPRAGGIAFAMLIVIVAFIVIPDPNSHIPTPDKWDHRLVSIYCNHALLIMYLDDAEKTCTTGPESRQFMQEDLQMLAHYPVYQIILNVIPYTLPAIAGFLVLLALPKDRHRLILQLNRFFIPIMVTACFVVLTFLALVIPY